MAYGDDRPSSAQRSLAIAAITVAMLELCYCWLVSGMMAAAPNPSLVTISSLLFLIVVANVTLLFGARRPRKHWLRIFSATSIFAMVGAPVTLLFYVMARTGN